MDVRVLSAKREELESVMNELQRYFATLTNEVRGLLQWSPTNIYTSYLLASNLTIVEIHRSSPLGWRLVIVMKGNEMPKKRRLFAHFKLANARYKSGMNLQDCLPNVVWGFSMKLSESNTEIGFWNPFWAEKYSRMTAFSVYSVITFLNAIIHKCYALYSKCVWDLPFGRIICRIQWIFNLKTHSALYKGNEWYNSCFEYDAKLPDCEY